MYTFEFVGVCKVELLQFRVLLVVGKLSFLSPSPNTPTPMSSSTSGAEREETRCKLTIQLDVVNCESESEVML